MDDGRWIDGGCVPHTALARAVRLQAEADALRDELAALTAERDKLQAFKDWVHGYLDAHGVPHHPPGTHGTEGCRIGDRMDWLMVELATARAERDIARQQLVALERHAGAADALEALAAACRPVASAAAPYGGDLGDSALALVAVPLGDLRRLARACAAGRAALAAGDEGG